MFCPITPKDCGSVSRWHFKGLTTAEHSAIISESYDQNVQMNQKHSHFWLISKTTHGKANFNNVMIRKLWQQQQACTDVFITFYYPLETLPLSFGLIAAHFCSVLCLCCILFCFCLPSFAAHFLDDAHVSSNWWCCLLICLCRLSLHVFCLHACVFLNCRALSSGEAVISQCCNVAPLSPLNIFTGCVINKYITIYISQYILAWTVFKGHSKSNFPGSHSPLTTSKKHVAYLGSLTPIYKILRLGPRCNEEYIYIDLKTCCIVCWKQPCLF